MQLLETYQSLATLTARMADAAIENNWDLLVELAEEHERLSLSISKYPLQQTNMAKEQFIALITEILTHQTAIESATTPRMNDIKTLLNQQRTNKALQSTYLSSD